MFGDGLWNLDVIELERTNETFRLLYDVKGRFRLHRITPEEGKVSRRILVDNTTTHVHHPSTSCVG